MRLIDLTEAYLRSVVAGGNWREYESLYPALFKHYFRYWAKRSYPNVSLDAKAIRFRTQLIKKGLSSIRRKFARHGMDIGSLDIVLFVGKNCTNGHAFFDDGKWVVWIPVESYETELLVSVFVTHEIAHALHYMNSRRFYFASGDMQRRFSRQLLTEGLATYVTGEILECGDGVALWADFVTEGRLRRWMAECERRRSELNKFALKYFESRSKAVFFQANEPTDILQYRAGYYLGLNLIRQIAINGEYSMQQLITIPRRKLEILAKGILLRE